MTDSISLDLLSSQAASSQTNYQALTQETKSKLEALGISTAGVTTEAQGQALLATAGTNNDGGEQDKEGGGQKPKEEPAWVSSMESLGLSPTGSEESDISAVNSTIESLEFSEASSLAQSFRALGLMVDLPEDPQLKNAVGQDQLSKVNQYMLFN